MLRTIAAPSASASLKFWEVHANVMLRSGTLSCARSKSQNRARPSRKKMSYELWLSDNAIIFAARTEAIFVLTKMQLSFLAAKNRKADASSVLFREKSKIAGM